MLTKKLSLADKLGIAGKNRKPSLKDKIGLKDKGRKADTTLKVKRAKKK